MGTTVVKVSRQRHRKAVSAVADPRLEQIRPLQARNAKPGPLVIDHHVHHHALAGRRRQPRPSDHDASDDPLQPIHDRLTLGRNRHVSHHTERHVDEDGVAEPGPPA